MSATEAAELLARAGRTREAIALAAPAGATFERNGARRDLARLDSFGLLKSRRRAATAKDQLTATQLKVAELVAKGLTSAEIGRQLYISRRTVEGHLAKIYASLGVHSRVELALWFVEGTRSG
jgi:DNA-binding NarL/FixJ family response regulator